MLKKIPELFTVLVPSTKPRTEPLSKNKTKSMLIDKLQPKGKQINSKQQ